MTLVELIVAMMIFSVVLAIVGSAIGQMTQATVRVAGTGDGISSAEKVFTRLDKQVPYARSVNPPAQVGDAWYLEFLTEVQAGGYPAGCWQYRFTESTALLQVRRSTRASPAAVTAWTTVATGVQRRGPTPADPADVDDPPPFTMYPTGTGYSGAASLDGYQRQRLEVALQVRAARGPATVLESTWVARNSTPDFESKNPRVCDGMPRT